MPWFQAMKHLLAGQCRYKVRSWAACGSRHCRSACSSSQCQGTPGSISWLVKVWGVLWSLAACACWRFSGTVKLASLYFREALRDLLMRTHSLDRFWCFTTCGFKDTEQGSEGVHALCAQHTKALLFGRANTLKVFYWTPTLKHLPTPRCVCVLG